MLDSNAKSITALTGPQFINVIINWALFGFLSNQVYFYSQVFPNDRRTIKALVYSVYLLELVQTILQTETTWKMQVHGFGNIDGIDEVGTAWLSICVIGDGVTLIVQWFYAYRLTVLSQSKKLAGVIVLISTISYAGALATGIIGERAKRFSVLLADHRSQIFATTGVWGGAAAVCDVMITISTCYYLQKQKNRGFHKTQAILSKIILMTVETGALSAFFPILTMILFYSPSLSGLSYYMAPLFAVVNFYAVAMLAILNNRMNIGILSDSQTWVRNEFPMSHNRSMIFRQDLESLTSSSQNMSLFVRTQKEVVVTADEPKVRSI